MSPQPAGAQPPAHGPDAKPAHPKQSKGPKIVQLEKLGGIHTLTVAPGRSTYVSMPGYITHPAIGYLPPTIDVKSDGKKLRITPSPNAKLDTEINVHVDFVYLDIINSHVSLDIIVKPSREADPPIIDLEADEQAIKDWARSMVEDEIAAAEARGREKGKAEGKAEGRREQLRLESRQALREASSATTYRDQLIATYDTSASAGAERVKPRLLPTRWNDAGTHLLTPFDVCNRGPKPFRLATVQATSLDGRIHRVEVTHIADPSFGRNQLIATIENRMCVRGVLAIELAQHGVMEQFDIEWAEPEGGRWLSAKILKWTTRQVALATLTPEEEFMQRVREREAREARARQLIVGPRITYGACWIASGLDGNNLDATDCTAVGVHLVKGFFESVAFEAELVGGWTGEASFKGVMIGDEQRDLRRNAKLGRVTAGGVLRFGDKTIPYVRLGVGFQGISYDSQLSLGTSTDGPDDSLELTGFFTLGGGLQARLGEHIMAGIALSFVNSTDNKYRSLDAGIHIGYGWNP